MRSLGAGAGAVFLIGVLFGAVSLARPAVTRGGSGPPTLVLLHGYGSSSADWEPFVATIAPGSSARFVFPEGQVRVARPDGGAGHAWWRMDLDRYFVPPTLLPDLSKARPPGLVAAASATQRLVAVQKPPVILGGFSQGAMVAAEVAFTSGEPLAALVLLSVSPIDEAAWRRGLASRRGLRVFLAHGRDDRSLSFAAAERLRRELEDSGLEVTWFPFDGGHEITAKVVQALDVFLDGLPRVAAAP